MTDKLFNGKDARLCINQWGQPVWARTLKELRAKSGHGSSPRKQFSDKKDGRCVWSGYVIGPEWFTVYAPLEVAQ